ncbi:hypothetical protein [Treponema denticola]|uniref:hypothetical protein n=1 Tax=Treponema denticola TaxID=158 RepID=UPI002104ABCC|nr:hypothetical protein [Treponema denticola]UTY23435.1 hypothetical protein E4N78_04255 [Treponema denticola]
MTIDKVWCKECYAKLCKAFDKEYGKGNWSFANLEIGVTLDSEQCKYIFFPPALMIEFLLKKKNGQYSKFKKRKGSYFPDFCPFCGKKIKPEDVEE